MNWASPMPDQTRRRFLFLAGGAAGATAAWSAFGAASSDSGPLVLDPALGEIVSSGALSIELGEKYLHAAGATMAKGGELGRLVNGIPRGLSPAQLTAAIRERVGRDFAEGATCQVDGWQLSQTECRLAAVAFLFLKSGGRVAEPQADPDGPLAHLPAARFAIVDRWGPQLAQAGEPFNVQRSGDSAMWFRFSRLDAVSFEVFIGKYPARTIVKPGELFAVANLSERLAKELVSRPGAYPVFLVDAGRGKQLIGHFNVRPRKVADQVAPGFAFVRKEISEIRIGAAV